MRTVDNDNTVEQYELRGVRRGVKKERARWVLWVCVGSVTDKDKEALAPCHQCALQVFYYKWNVHIYRMEEVPRVTFGVGVW